jgi:hypothetical protein
VTASSLSAVTESPASSPAAEVDDEQTAATASEEEIAPQESVDPSTEDDAQDQGSEEGSEEEGQAGGRVRCVGTTQKGTQCRKLSVAGTDLCPMHSG